MTDSEYILALEDLVRTDDPPQFVWEARRDQTMSRRVLRAHVEDWWEASRPPADGWVSDYDGGRANNLHVDWQAYHDAIRYEADRAEFGAQGFCRQCVSEKVGRPEKGMCTCGHGSLVAPGVKKVQG